MAAHDVKTNILHLYRSLLRAATYLPDEPARSYAHSQIVYRFKNASTSTSDRLRTGRQALSTLQRAANGEMGSLENVLRQTYGRVGRRRRVLVERMQRPQEKAPASDAEVAQLLNKSTASGAYFKPNRPALDALMLSQMQNRPPEWNRFKFRSVEPKIPEENIWGRPVPMKARPGIRRRFWKKALDALLPPLPTEEWDRLRDLSTGVIRPELPPQRRPGRAMEAESTIMLTAENLKVPISHALANVTRDLRLSRERHKVTPRFMRRMYASVWCLCPKLELLDGDKWRVTWGGSRSAASRGVARLPEPAEMELFDGIDDLPRMGKLRHR